MTYKDIVVGALVSVSVCVCVWVCVCVHFLCHFTRAQSYVMNHTACWFN